MTDDDPDILKDRTIRTVRVILEVLVALVLLAAVLIVTRYLRYSRTPHAGIVWLPDAPTTPMTPEGRRMQALLDRIPDPVPGKAPLPSTAILQDVAKVIRSTGGSCDSVRRSYERSATERSRIVDFQCRNGGTYVVRTTARGTISVLTCDELKAFTSLECFRFEH